MIANVVSKNEIQADEARMFSSFFTYDAYVRMVPQPMLSEKNACPIAAIHVSAVTLLKSGTNIYLTPSMAPGSVSERTTTITMMMNSMVIMTFDIRSIPLRTPNTMIAPVSPRKISV